jgi:hypothetical protein
MMLLMAVREQQRRAEEIQLEIFRRMTPQQRLECCFRWTELTYEFARSAIRQDHPDWTPLQVDREIGRRITGIDVTKLPWEKTVETAQTDRPTDQPVGSEPAS